MGCWWCEIGTAAVEQWILIALVTTVFLVSIFQEQVNSVYKHWLGRLLTDSAGRPTFKKPISWSKPPELGPRCRRLGFLDPGYVRPNLQGTQSWSSMNFWHYKADSDVNQNDPRGGRSTAPCQWIQHMHSKPVIPGLFPLPCVLAREIMYNQGSLSSGRVLS
jgi:hypothetical protein